MTTAENPFEYRRPVAPAEAIGRAEEAAQLEALALEGNNARLVAPPGYGKTSLVRRVQEQLREEGWATVHVPLLGVTTMRAFAGRVIEAFARTLGPSTRESFSDRAFELTEKSERQSAGVGAASADRLVSLLRQLPKFSVASGRRAHLVFDDFDDLDALPGPWEKVLRSEIQHHRQAVSYVFSGSRRSTMQYAFTSIDRAFYSQAVLVTLEPFTDQPLRTYVADRFAASGKTLLRPSLDALVGLCHGHPRRAMQAAHVLWQVTESVAGPEQWADARAALMEEVAGEMEAAWRVSNPYARRALWAVAMDEFPPSVIPGNHVQAMLHALAEWLSGEAIVARAGTQWHLVDPLLAEWIRSGCGWPPQGEHTARQHKTVRGIWKGVSISEEDIAEVRREMSRPLLGDEVDEIWPEAGDGAEQP